MHLEKISCPICDSDDNRETIRSKDFRYNISDETFSVVKCDNCGFFFLNPRPLKLEVFKFYPSAFHQKDSSFFYKLIEPYFKIAQKSTINLLKKYKKVGKSLDIGCGTGGFVMAMLQNGFDAWGIEPNSEAGNFTDNCLTQRIFYKELKDCHFLEKTFDIITCFQSLEHIYDLNELLSGVRRVLKDDGLLYICVPDTNFFEFKMFGGYSYNLEVPRHLYFFTKRSVNDLLLRNGLMVERFLRNAIFEIILTPASFYHSLVYFLNDRKININAPLRYLFFMPAVFFRLMMRILLLFEGQNLKLICNKNNDVFNS